MQVKCKYCDSYISDVDERCSSCGAPNDLLIRTASGAPKTIEELKNWYVAHNLPDENITRFFIGKDIKEARAFGIYKDEQTKNFIVYKNKDNGSRMVRYEGKDEAYAVNELYQKLKIEIQNQKYLNSTSTINKNINNENQPIIIEEKKSKYPVNNTILTAPRTYDVSEPKSPKIVTVIFVIVLVITITSLVLSNGSNRGRTSNSSSTYYSSNNNSSYYNDNYHSSSYDDWDSGSSWDSSDSWDSGGTDWSSDW